MLRSGEFFARLLFEPGLVSVYGVRGVEPHTVGADELVPDDEYFAVDGRKRVI